MRQALSMLIDRDAYLEAIFALSNFERDGVPVEVGWHSHVPCSWPTIWLDPKKNELGENSKYFHYNVAEAKKLLAAAGYNNQPLLFQQADRHAAKPMEVLRGMWSEGFNLEVKILPYEPTWRQTCQTSAGADYNGICYNPGTGFNAEQHIVRWYTPEGRYRFTTEETPILTPLARKIRAELDGNRQTELIKEFQRDAAKAMPLIMSIGSTTGFALKWPWLENKGAWTDTRTSTHVKSYYWYNKALDPNANKS
jgi:ABC-type transport system substrate-binding protein